MLLTNCFIIIRSAVYLSFHESVILLRLTLIRSLRVLSQQQDITSQRAEAEREVDLSVLSSHAAKQAAFLAKRGQTKEARIAALAQGKLMQRCGMS